MEIDEAQGRNKYTSKEIWNNLGVTHYCLKDYDNAKECFAKALEIDPDFKLAEHNKIITFHKMNIKL